MKNIFFYTTLLALFFFSPISGQELKHPHRLQESNTIEGLSLYPNPVSNGKVYITTKNDIEKEIQIFDVLGKKVLHTLISSKELNIASLSPGVYIIKIREEEASATRKLIVR